MVQFMSGDGTWAKLAFQLAAINKPLVSVSKLIDDGWRVVFDKDLSYLLHKESKKVIRMKRERGVFVVDAWVQPEDKTEGFSRLG